MTELIICTTCRTTDTPREHRAAGDILLEAVQAAQAFGEKPKWAMVTVRAMACLGGCSRSCTAAFQAQGKHSYLFGDLAATDDVAQQLLDCAALHQLAPDGALPRESRPSALVGGMLARLTPAL
jgi:predicted metal-binding protein